MTDDVRQGRRLGNNELILRIGRGGMATVWVAREHSDGRGDDRLVAVKALLADLADEAEFVRMFIDEVRLVRAIRHPNVVKVFDVGEDDGVMWMSMEWVEGDSLHAIIAEAGKRRAIPPDMAVRIIADAAAGLHAAHELRDDQGRLRGVVHRDISPHNVLIGTNGVIKLVDFGVAKAVGRMSETTRAGQLKGKFGYMSPEQALGRAVDRRSDIFSLGIVLFELTTSRRLFRGDSDIETLKLINAADVPRPSSIDADYPPELERIVLRALEKDPARRHQSAAELEAELRQFLKARHTVVPESGVAGLLKRVMGGRIEQRRKAVRSALRVLGRDGAPSNDLLSSDPAFTPTGKGDEQVSGVNPMTATGTDALSDSVAAPDQQVRATVSRTKRRRSQRRGRVSLSWASALGYAIGVAGLAIALIVLLLLRR